MARRKSQGKSLKPVIIIFTEGDTEKKYFDKLCQKYKSKIAVKSIKTRKQGLSIVEEANKLLNNKKSDVYNLKSDSVYIVFDKDDLDEFNFDRALKKAEEYQFKIGFSNEAFEVWLLSHFEPVNKKMSRTESETFRLS